jgi:hypothetical protein
MIDLLIKVHKITSDTWFLDSIDSARVLPTRPYTGSIKFRKHIFWVLAAIIIIIEQSKIKYNVLKCF